MCCSVDQRGMITGSGRNAAIRLRLPSDLSVQERLGLEVCHLLGDRIPNISLFRYLSVLKMLGHGL